MASSFFSRRQETDRSPDLGLDLENTLHGEQTFEFERVPVAGDVLHGEGEISDVYLREGSSGRMLFIERTTTFYDQHDSPVVSSINTIIDTDPTVED